METHGMIFSSCLVFCSFVLVLVFGENVQGVASPSHKEKEDAGGMLFLPQHS